MVLGTSAPMHGAESVTPEFSLDIFNNGNLNNQSIANAGVIRMWTQLNGSGALVPYNEIEVTAYDQSGNCALQHVRNNRIWDNTDYFNFIDVNKRGNWQAIDFTITAFGQTLEIPLINVPHVSDTIEGFTTMVFQESWRDRIIVWFFLDGEAYELPLSSMEMVVDSTSVNIRDFVGNIAPHQNRIRVIQILRDAKVNNVPWQEMTVTLTLNDEIITHQFTNNRKPSGEEPYISILTPFPEGAVTISFLDIEYIATPSPGAVITEVYYTINNGSRRFIYLSAASGFTPMGTLGEARVFITPQPDNHFVFTVRDSAGGMATYEVDNRPTFDMGMMYAPPYDPDLLLPITEHEYVIGDRLSLRASRVNRTQITPEHIAEAVAEIDGFIISMFQMTGYYVIQIPPVSTYEELVAIGEAIIAAHPDLFHNFHLHFVGNEAYEFLYFEDEPWLIERWLLGRYNSINTQWGIDAIGITAARERFGNQEIEVKTGIVDFGGILHTHEALGIPYENVMNFYQRKHFGTELMNHCHGTQVMSVIGATHGSGADLEGVANFNRNDLYSYDMFRLGAANSDPYILAGLRWNVFNGVQVINFSVGADVPRPSHRAERFSEEMEDLLNIGYDFIVVQSSGNHRLDSWNTRVFSHSGRVSFSNPQELRNPEDARLFNRTITVGASTENGRIWDMSRPFGGGSNRGSGWGWFVDVIAPGDDVLTAISIDRATGTQSNAEYLRDSGTSLAAPFVSGVAALVWSLNPGLTGEQVKQIIVDSARYEVDEEHREATSENAGRDATAILDTRNRRGNPYYQVNAYRAMVMARYGNLGIATDGRLIGLVVQPWQENLTNNLTDYIGPPVHGANVRLYNVDTLSFVSMANTREDGRFIINRLPPGRYQLVISATGFVTERSDTFTVTAGVTAGMHILALPEGDRDISIGLWQGEFDTPFSICLEAATYTELPERNPILDTVTLEVRLGRNINDLSGEIIRTESAIGGRHEMTLPAGHYIVTASAAGFLPITKEITLFGGAEPLELDMILTPILSQPMLRIKLELGPEAFEDYVWGYLYKIIYWIPNNPDKSYFIWYMREKSSTYIRYEVLKNPSWLEGINITVNENIDERFIAFDIHSLLDGQYIYRVNLQDDGYHPFPFSGQVYVINAQNEVIAQFDLLAEKSEWWGLGFYFVIEVVNGQYSIMPS